MLSRIGFTGSRSGRARGRALSTCLSLSQPAQRGYGNFSQHFPRQAPASYNQYGKPVNRYGQPVQGGPKVYFQNYRESRGRRWARRSGTMGIVMATSVGIVWVTCQEEAPVQAGKHFNCIGFERILREEAKWDSSAKLMAAVLETMAPREPGLIWPDDHPTTIVVKKIWSRLVKASGNDPESWQLYVVNAPSISDCVADMKGRTIVYSGALRAAEDEAGLATIISSAIAAVTINSPAVELSHGLFQYIAAVPAVQLIATSFFLKRLWFVALPYTFLYAAYLNRYAGAAGRERSFLECSYVSFIYMYRAGYDLEDVMGFAVRNFQRSKELLEDIDATEEGVIEEEFKEDIRESHHLDHLRVVKMHEWTPKIQAEFGTGRMEVQKPKLLPTEVYQHPGDYQPSVAYDEYF